MAKTSATIKELPLAEITLRRYEKPYDLTSRELVKKLCLIHRRDDFRAQRCFQDRCEVNP